MTDKILKPDDVVGGYRIVKTIGKGGMGAVFEGVHETTGERAAIKILHAHHSQDPESLARFLNEGKAISALQHPGIVRLLGSGTMANGGCYIAMEFIDGETLSAKLKRDKRLGRQGLRLARQVASALQAAHRRNIVHRDLKPSNILLRRADQGEPEVRIIDFGIAKMSVEDREVQDFHTRTGTMIGTPVYMAPEQCRGVAVTDRTDVYALGVILYQMLTGRPPFYSQADGDILAMHILVPPKPLREVEPAIPERVAELVERMLGKESTERPSMAEVELSLADLAEDQQWSPRRFDDGKTAVTPNPTPLQFATADSIEAPPTHLGGSLAAPTLGAINGQTASQTKRSSFRLGLLIAGSALLITGTATTFIVLRSKPAVTPPTTFSAGRTEQPLPAAHIDWQLHTTPPGARVFDANGTDLGQTPWRFSQPPKPGTQQLLVRKAGYSDLLLQFPKDRDTTRHESLVLLPTLKAAAVPTKAAPTAAKNPAGTQAAKTTGSNKVRKNDGPIFDFKTHRKLN